MAATQTQETSKQDTEQSALRCRADKSGQGWIGEDWKRSEVKRSAGESWQIGMFPEEDSSVAAPSTSTPAVQQQLSALPAFESVKNWVKDLSALKDFTFMDLYTFLIKSKDKEFNQKSLRPFKIAQGLFILQR